MKSSRLVTSLGHGAPLADYCAIPMDKYCGPTPPPLPHPFHIPLKPSYSEFLAMGLQEKSIDLRAPMVHNSRGIK